MHDEKGQGKRRREEENDGTSGTSCYFHDKGFNQNCKTVATRSDRGSPLTISEKWLDKRGGSHLQEAIRKPICTSCVRCPGSLEDVRRTVRESPPLPSLLRIPSELDSKVPRLEIVPSPPSSSPPRLCSGISSQ